MENIAFKLGETFKKVSQKEIEEYKRDDIPEESKTIPVWSDADGEVFSVRTGPNYTKNKKKATSGPALYECISVDMVQSDSKQKISNVASMVELPKPRDEDDLKAIEKSGLPRLIIVNVQVPHKEASMMAGGSYYDDDAGCSLVLVFTIKPETVEHALDESTEESLKGINAQIKMLRKFNQTAATDKDVKRRFKAILFAENWDDITHSAMYSFKGYNGKPAIINNMGVLYQDKDKKEFMELDVKIRDAKYMSKKGLDLLKSRARDGKIRIGFTIQGESDEELPENIFGCSKFTNVSLDAKDIKKIKLPEQK